METLSSFFLYKKKNDAIFWNYFKTSKNTGTKTIRLACILNGLTPFHQSSPRKKQLLQLIDYQFESSIQP